MLKCVDMQPTLPVLYVKAHAKTHSKQDFTSQKAFGSDSHIHLSVLKEVEMSVFNFPNAVSVGGINVRGDFFPTVVKEGTDFDNYKLNKEEDVLLATYLRTG